MINILSIIGYLVVVAYSAFMFWFLHSHFFFIVLIMLAAAPVLSIISNFILRHFVSVEINRASDLYGKQDDETYFIIDVHNPSFFMSLDAKVHITVSNEFFGTVGEQVISIPVHARGGYTIKLPIIAHYPGVIKLEVKRIDIKDMLGMFYLKRKAKTFAEAIIMPLRINDVSYDAVNFEQGMLESEESTKRGNDFSDVQEIREYIPGDKLMSIHWKLSAKRDILMVKDRVSMSDKQLVVLPELCNSDKEVLTQILSVTYTMIHQMISDKTTVRLMYFSINRYEYEDIRIDYPDELNDAFAKLFYEKTYEGADEAASHMSSVHPEMKAYIHVTSENGQAVIHIRENV